MGAGSFGIEMMQWLAGRSSKGSPNVPGAISWADQSATANRRVDGVAPAATRPAASPDSDQVWSLLADGRRQATVLFADIVASSHMVGGADPEDARDRLRAILERMEAQITRFGGTLCPTLGDGVMAVFGSPRAQEDHAIRACFAADAIVLEALRSAAADRPVPVRSVPFNVRVGVASGEILWDSVGYRTGGRPAAVGEPVHLAAKLQQTSPVNGIRLAGATAALVTEWVDTEPAGTYDLSPSRRVELHAQKAILQTRRPVAEPTPFVGRERQIGQIKNALAELAAGRGSAHFLLGDAGMGKTRLIRQVLKDAAGVRILCWPQIQIRAVGTPEPFARIATDFLGIDAAQDRVTLEAQLATIDGLSESAAASFADTLFPAAAENGVPAAVRLRSAAEAVAHMALRAGRSRPLLIVIEDLHWASSEIAAVADRMAARCGEGSVLLLVTSRQAPANGSTLAEAAKLHRLPALSEAAAITLFRHASAGAPQLFHAGPSLIDRAQGNPFYLLQCVQALLESPSDGGDPKKLPATVLGLLAARIDALADSLRGVLWAASVVGPTIDAELLAILLDQPTAAAVAALNQLAELGFVDNTRILPRPEYTFRHALIHEAAYNTLTKRDRRRLHAQLAKALVQDWAAELPGRDEAVARHAHGGELWDLALEYGWRAARDAGRRSRAREATELFSAAKEALATLEGSASPPTPIQSIELRIDRARLAMALGLGADMKDELRQAIEIAHAAGDCHREALALSILSTFEWVYGDLTAAAEMAEEALRISLASDDPAVRFESVARLGGLFVEIGNAANGLRAWEEAELCRRTHGAACGTRLTLDCEVLTLTGRARCLVELGTGTEALQLARLAMDVADQTDQPFNRWYAACQLGMVAARVEDFELCQAAMQACIENSDASGASILRSVGLGGLGLAQVHLGQATDGLANLAQAVADLVQRGLTADATLVRTWHSKALLFAGNAAAALKAAEAALNDAIRIRATGLQAAALLAQAQARQKLAEPLGDGLATAIDLAGPLGLHRLVADCAAVREDRVLVATP